MFSAFTLRNILIFIYLSLPQPSLSHERQIAGEEPSSHPCAIHQMFTFFFWRRRTVNTAPPRTRAIRHWLSFCRLCVVMYIERDNIFNLFALVLMASALYWQPWINLHKLYKVYTAFYSQLPRPLCRFKFLHSLLKFLSCKRRAKTDRGCRPQAFQARLHCLPNGTQKATSSSSCSFCSRAVSRVSPWLTLFKWAAFRALKKPPSRAV